MESSTSNVLGSGKEEECNSCESGWTMYIGSPIHDGYDDDGKSIPDAAAADDDDDDDSMASDASSGPSHEIIAKKHGEKNEDDNDDDDDDDKKSCASYMEKKMKKKAKKEMVKKMSPKKGADMDIAPSQTGSKSKVRKGSVWNSKRK